MSFLKAALELAALGFHVFPLEPNSKIPAIMDFPKAASRDPERIKKWWIDPVMELEQPYNIGISTSRFGESEALLVIDVDNKEGKNGDAELKRIEGNGLVLPPTFVQSTPTGGKHIVFRTSAPVRQGVDVLGRGLDIRSRGGYIVGAGSCVEAGTYTRSIGRVDAAPEWVVTRCGRNSGSKSPEKSKKLQAVDPIRAETRAIQYLEHEAPLAIEGEGGDQTTFKVAAKVKDLGVDELTALLLLLDHWNERCSPPWAEDELKKKVEHAYRYGSNPQGSAAPEAHFTKIEEEKAVHPFMKLNQEYAYIGGSKGTILHETTDEKGRFNLEYIKPDTFHMNLAPETIFFDGKTQQLSRVWIKSPDRRSYDGVVFAPGKKVSDRFYNLWRGFAYEPLPPGVTGSKRDVKALDAFQEHLERNVCGGDGKLALWLMGYFAHLIQRPWEKPLVALVFRGEKGVGKNALIERVGALLGRHFMVVSNPRFLVGNFNSHLENKLMLTFDEAFWSGDHRADAILKDLITGYQHVIERKGMEAYTVDNKTRVAILGNADWLVPASEGERRFAVFDVGSGRKDDRAFFREMREGMEAGGYRLLLRYLLDFDLSQVDVDQAPKTKALLDQKISGLGPVQRWWNDSLKEGRIAGSDFDGWPGTIEKERLREAFRRYADAHRLIKSHAPSNETFSRELRRMAPDTQTKRIRDDGGRVNVYVVPPLTKVRSEWEKFIGHEVVWENDESELEEIL